MKHLRRLHTAEHGHWAGGPYGLIGILVVVLLVILILRVA